MLNGHADGDAVLLARRGSEIFAVGATCSHYSAPLVDGAVFGTELRCPWHHACFDLQTGEPTRAPALLPIATWNVERRDGRIFVTSKKSTGPSKVSTKQGVRSVGIVGSGPAGNAVAEMLRRRGFDGTITMFAAEPAAPVDRPNLSKDYLAGTAPEEWMTLPGAEDVALINKRVTKLDAASRTLTIDDGTKQSFDAIVLATGCDVIKLPLPGSDATHVYYLRTLADSRAIIAAAQSGKRAVILGASFIALEVAASLRARNVDVTIVGPEAVPLGRILGDEVGTWIRGLHQSHGVQFKLGMTAAAIERDHVKLADGSSLPADFVVIGVGVRPNVALAEAAGLEVDKGIVVDEFLCTSANGIYAIGDVARWPERISGRKLRVEHFVVAERHGQIAAENIVGLRKPYRDVPFFWSAHYDIALAYVGNAPHFDSVEVRGSLSDAHALVAYRKQGRVQAVATVFLDRESLAIEHAMERGDDSEVERIVASVS